MSSRALCSYAPADEMDNTYMYLEALGIQEDDINHIVIADYLKRLLSTSDEYRDYNYISRNANICPLNFIVFQHFVLTKLSKKSSINN